MILKKTIVDEKASVLLAKTSSRHLAPVASPGIVIYTRTIPSLSHFFLCKKALKNQRKRKKTRHLIQELKTPCWAHQWLFGIVIQAPGRVYKRFLCANNNNEGGEWKKKGRWIKTIVYIQRCICESLTHFKPHAQNVHIITTKSSLIIVANNTIIIIKRVPPPNLI